MSHPIPSDAIARKNLAAKPNTNMLPEVLLDLGACSRSQHSLNVRVHRCHWVGDIFKSLGIRTRKCNMRPTKFPGADDGTFTF